MQGLLRSPRRGRAPAPVLSFTARDDCGLAARVAAPVQVLAQRDWEEPALLARAAMARQALVRARIGGEWWQRSPVGLLPRDGYALIVFAEPAAAGCASVFDDGIQAKMLDRALAEHPAEGLAVAASERRIGWRLRARLADAAGRGAAVIRHPFDPWPAVERAGHVYSAGGEIGFLALLAGKPVSAFADAFYTGWGATRDDPQMRRHGFHRTIDEIFAGACLLATHCRDPFRDLATSFEEVVDILADWRRLEEANREIAVCVGMSFWKRRRIADFVRTASGAPPFRRTAAGALAAAERAGGAAIAGWASRLPAGLGDEVERRGLRLIRVEDGFVRSVGLGSDFLPPSSLVFDRNGMYYDPRNDSDLHRILREARFDAKLLARAEHLLTLLVARGVTKYNLAGPVDAAAAAELAAPPDRRCVLVPGQVEDDLSIVYGAGTVRRNLDLLAEVRRANPGAYIVYKPHPDVLAGHRKGAVMDEAARRFADAIVAGGSLPALLARADELHTMTSLAGFEALLRGRRVVVYGRPFYAGWGLTDDRPPFDRGRRLSLVELVAGALILYPRYLDPLTRLPCGPEVVIERLDQPALWRPGPVVAARRMQGWIKRQFGDRRPAPPPASSASVRWLREREQEQDQEQKQKRSRP